MHEEKTKEGINERPYVMKIPGLRPHFPLAHHTLDIQDEWSRRTKSLSPVVYSSSLPSILILNYRISGSSYALSRGSLRAPSDCCFSPRRLACVMMAEMVLDTIFDLHPSTPPNVRNGPRSPAATISQRMFIGW
jgi:hypothetical protein